MDKSPIVTTVLASVFQFYVSIVDPSILAQPLAPAGPSGTVPASADVSSNPQQQAVKVAPQQGLGTTGAMDSALPQDSGEPTPALH